MKTKNLITILGLSLLSLNNSVGQTPEHYEALKKYTPLTKEMIDSSENKSKLMKDFNNLPERFKKNINKIYIIKQKDFFKWGELGHGCYEDGTICLSKENYTEDLLFHEAIHQKQRALDNVKSDFKERWMKIAKLDYRKKNSPTSENGLLSIYASFSLYEDGVTFMEALRYDKSPNEVKDSFGVRPSIYITYPLYFADTTDSRYQQKLDLLEEYNFLTKEECEKLSKNLGSLNYLLNKK